MHQGQWLQMEVLWGTFFSLTASDITVESIVLCQERFLQIFFEHQMPPMGPQSQVMRYFLCTSRKSWQKP